MKSDGDIVDEVRRRAHELSRQFDHDLDKYAEHLRTIEAQHADRVVGQITVVKTSGPTQHNGPPKSR